MLKNLSKYLKELLASVNIGSKDKVRMGLIIAFIAVCGIGIGSSLFLPPDNPIEEIAEQALEEMILVQIDVPGQDPVYGWLDLSPSTPEKKVKYMEND